jgi:Outer membrane protein beta-barrel domain
MNVTKKAPEPGNESFANQVITKGMALCLLLMVAFSAQAQKVESFGLFMGMNFPFTLDVGLHKDPRYFGQFTLRATPVGFSYGYDNVGYGFLMTPSFVKIGQKFAIQNTAGGTVGKRDVQMDYFSLPMALKLHLNDLAFFRLSVVAAVNFDYLISGKEVITHSASKLKYPKGVIIPSDPGYTEVYDGVFVPEINGQTYVTKDKFRSFQISAGVGFHSDFDFNDDWSMSFDGRAVFGIFDPRKDSYLNTLRGPGDTADLFGQRREVYLAASVGFSRIIQIKETFKAKSTKSGGSYSKPRNRKPRG